MVCIVEFDNSYRFDFAKNKCKQKIWIKILLKFSKTDIDHLAHILDLPAEKLNRVYQGIDYLDKEPAERLGQLFLVTFCD
ncbi:hypothetical protein OQJ05_03645 [Fluoribacter gormanii]|uniref:hypothetical protein n=1 Tax=Fluoribacter gormanii TaxID=464 RepID=UPI00224319DC|nr:hypothetical protein [Fluoribacter gormanii]MCW8443147.1 hypothetical protein [Fluoribacter gormanii]